MGTLASISAAHVAFNAQDRSEPSSLITCIGRRVHRHQCGPRTYLSHILHSAHLHNYADLCPGKEHQLQHALCSLP